MDRRDFLRAALTAGAAAAADRIGGTAMANADGAVVGGAATRPAGREKASREGRVGGGLAKRALGKTGKELSIIGMGGIVVMNAEQEHANRIVPEFIDRGVNYIDVAPSYGNAEEKLGPALQPHRSKVFLACKTAKRDRKGAEEELQQTFKRLRTDHFDLYQLHGLTKMEELDECFGENGAMKTFEAARKAGKIGLIGFSAHSVEVALAAMDRFDFDTILFPFNYVCWKEGNFGPQVLEKARKKGLGILALKAMAYTPWGKDEKRTYEKCWYKPADEPGLAEAALRFTLSQGVTAALPPGDEKMFRVALDIAGRFKPMTPAEQEALLAKAKGVTPIFKEA